jgi:hypothetical protein
MKRYFILTAAVLYLPASGLFLSSFAEPQGTAVNTTASFSGCITCHDKVTPDEAHRIGCTRCHKGNGRQTDKDSAHEGLLDHPASPQNMREVCGQCHADQVDGCGKSLHFTLKKAVNLTRDHFELTPPLHNLTRIPETDRPQNKAQLVDDMLRRRCLRCHVYTPGDSYPYVRRGTGCASCHMQFTDGKPDSHSLRKPGIRQCLSCHYGNHVGSDFIGRYEHDFNWEYRTPYTTRDPFVRPYGVELHELAPDIHEQRGLTCLDCHNGGEISGSSKQITCRGCHDPEPETVPLLAGVRSNGNELILTTSADQKEHLIPRLKHPAHEKYGTEVDCQVCHAQWSFNDRSTHLLLSYSDEVDPWDRLTVQSSSVVENFLEHNLYSDEDELEPAMPDAVTGLVKRGIWYLGFTQRRWEDIQVRRDRDGIIKVFRPVLDIRISAVDEDGDLLFDNVTGKDDGLLPYTPHTTGPAGLFYEQRFLHLLDRNPSKQNAATQ